MSEKIYIPAPQDPTNFNLKLGRLSGLAPNGTQKMQVIWGMDATCFRAGKPDAIKYPSFDKKHRGMAYWILEQWFPPTIYNRVQWEEDRFEGLVDLMGPFPENGIYGMVTPLFNERSEFLPLGTEALEICKQIIRSRDNRELDQTLLREKAKRAESLEQKAESERNTTRYNSLDQYFSRQDYYENKREYSFSTEPKTKVINGEKRTEAGIILIN